MTTAAAVINVIVWEIATASCAGARAPHRWRSLPAQRRGEVRHQYCYYSSAPLDLDSMPQPRHDQGRHCPVDCAARAGRLHRVGVVCSPSSACDARSLLRCFAHQQRLPFARLAFGRIASRSEPELLQKQARMQSLGWDGRLQAGDFVAAAFDVEVFVKTSSQVCGASGQGYYRAQARLPIAAPASNLARHLHGAGVGRMTRLQSWETRSTKLPENLPAPQVMIARPKCCWKQQGPLGRY